MLTVGWLRWSLGDSIYLVPLSGVFISRGKEDALVTRNLVPGETVYGEKRITVEVLFVRFRILYSPGEVKYVNYSLEINELFR